ncbi:MAG: glycosyltransferase family 4 protein [Caldilineaceae bacterium]|nr:glycosyltransferase family 4 protein [Caldilineaceae bacterium]
MHVLFVTGEYPPMQGGVGAYTQELGRALVALGADVTVLTSEQAARPVYVDRDDGIRVLPAVRRWDWTLWDTINGLAAEMSVDWIHVQYQTAAFHMHPAINFAPGRWRRDGKQVAWTYHDLLVPYLFPKAGRRLRTWVTERPAHKAQLVIVTNEGDRRQLAGHGLESVSIPIGSNIEARVVPPEDREARRAQRRYRKDTLVVGYFGFLNRSKGGLALVRTLHRLVQARPQVALLMVGERVGASDPTNYAYLQEVEALIAELGLADQVQWTGGQPDAEVAADLAACDVLLMPYEDGASLRRGTLMAGLAAGCAIVTTTPQAPLPELQEGRDLIYVPPGDDAAMAAAVLKIAGDGPLRARLQENARRASDQFTWDRIARRHMECYANFAANGTSTQGP